MSLGHTQLFACTTLIGVDVVGPEASICAFIFSVIFRTCTFMHVCTRHIASIKCAQKQNRLNWGRHNGGGGGSRSDEKNWCVHEV